MVNNSHITLEPGTVSAFSGLFFNKKQSVGLICSLILGSLHIFLGCWVILISCSILLKSYCFLFIINFMVSLKY